MELRTFSPGPAWSEDHVMQAEEVRRCLSGEIDHQDTRAMPIGGMVLVDASWQDERKERGQ